MVKLTQLPSTCLKGWFTGFDALSPSVIPESAHLNFCYLIKLAFLKVLMFTNTFTNTSEFNTNVNTALE